MSSKNGEVKKPKRQRAVITIKDRDDGKFDASIWFEPKIHDKKTGKIHPAAEQSIAVQAAWVCWKTLKNDQKGSIILTDEALSRPLSAICSKNPGQQ